MPVCLSSSHVPFLARYQLHTIGTVQYSTARTYTVNKGSREKEMRLGHSGQCSITTRRQCGRFGSPPPASPGLCPMSVQLSVGCLENSNMKPCCDMARSSSGNIYLCIRELSVVRCTDYGSVAQATNITATSTSLLAPFIMLGRPGSPHIRTYL